MSKYSEQLIEAMKAEARREVIDEGYILPPKAPACEFRKGQPVEVRDANGGNWRLDRFVKMSTALRGFPYESERGCYKHCRAAETNVNWVNDGSLIPTTMDGGYGSQRSYGSIYQHESGKFFIYMDDGRVAWMPDER